MFRFYLLLSLLVLPISAETLTFSTDDFNDVQSAVESLASNSDNVNELILPRGSYEGNLLISDNLIIRGIETAAVLLTNSSNTTPIMTVSDNVFVEIYNLTFSAGNTAIEFSGVSGGNINNNVFNLGSTNIAISLGNSTSANVFNNTFHDHETAIVVGNIITGITNNVFSSSTNSVLGLSDNTLLVNNLFISEPDGNELGVDSFTADDDFVSAANLDFHHTLMGGNVVDNGANIIGFDSQDNTNVDIGAYGGNLSDVFPKAIDDLALTSTSNTLTDVDLSLSWLDNTDYRVSGYFIYYDTDAGSSPYSGNLSGFDASPVDVGDNVSFDFNDMDLTFSLAAPTDVIGESLDSSLTISWDTVTSADNYTVEYRINGGGNSYATVNVEAATTTTITGLSNSVEYEVRVIAHALPTIYYSVAAYYDNDTSLGKISDISSSTNFLSASTYVSSAYSDNLIITPDATVAYPALPNNGGGCLLRSCK